MKATLRGILTLGLVWAVAASPAAGATMFEQGTPVDCAIPGIDDRCEKWAHKHAAREYTVTGALNGDGTRAFSVGHRSSGSKYELQTISYDVVAGEVLWVAREPGPTPDWHAMTTAAALSADDKTLYVAGKLFIESQPPKQDVVVVAYDTKSGARLWSHVYDGPVGGIDDAAAVAASPVDDKLFVAVSTHASQLPVKGGARDTDLALLVLDGRSGQPLDEATYGGGTFTVDEKTHGSADVATHLAVSSDGTRLALVGSTAGRQTYRDARLHATVVVWERGSEASTGLRRLWALEIPGAPLGLAVLSDGRVVFAGPFAEPADSNRPYAIVGLDATDGSTQWATRFALGGSYVEAPTALLVDEDRGMLYLPGLSRWPTDNYGTLGALALNASDGTVKWTTRLRDPRSERTFFNYDADDFPAAAVDPASGHLQVAARKLQGDLLTGLPTANIRTFSLDWRTGTKRWVGWHEHPLRSGPVDERAGPDWPRAVQAAAGRVVVFGSSFSPGIPLVGPYYDTRALTIAYEV